MVTRADIHLFLCAHGQLLPRWKEAFKSAKAGKWHAHKPGARGDEIAVVWLRLEQGRPVQAQLQEIPERFRAAPCVVLSDLPSDEEALAAFAAGARGYCNTHSAPLLLQRVAHVVLQGGLWIGETLMQRLLSATARIAVSDDPPPSQDWAHVLTEREREVATTLAQGASNKEIARKLDITERTVKAHVGAILEKLKVRDRLQLSLIVNGRVRSAEKVSA